MARGDITVFNETLAFMVDGGFEPSDTVKIALCTNAVTPTAAMSSPSLDNFTQISGGNYVVGGASIGTLAAVVTESAGVMTFSAASDVTWNQNPANPTNAYWGIVYDDTDSSNRAFAFIDLNGPVNMQAGDLVLAAGTIFQIGTLPEGDGFVPSTWKAINAPMEDVFPGSPPSGSPVNVMNAWSGGAYDTDRDRLVVWGGGHSDYAGNEVYVFNRETLAWSRITDPSSNVGGDESTGYYPDGLPRSRHTYNNIQYSADLDLFVSMGASGMYPSGQISVLNVDTFDFDMLDWDTLDSLPSGHGNPIGDISAYDPTTGFLWSHGSGNGHLCHYDPSTTNWTQHTATIYLEIYSTAAIAPTRQIMVAVGGANGIRVWDLANPNDASTSPTTSGDDTLESAQAPGFEWDEEADRFIGWDGGSTLYVLDPETWAWSTLPLSENNTVTPTAANTNGTYGRFRFIPERREVIVVNATDENVYLFRLPLRLFTLTSTTTQTSAPFTVGLAFAEGDIPDTPVLDLTDQQVIVKKRWNDGSVKHAIASGHISLSANVPKTVEVYNGSASGTPLTAADIETAAPTASVQCGSIGTVSLASLLSSPFRTWISGPEMVEAHYRSAVGADATLVVWFHVRLYKNDKLWVRAVVENGYVDISTVDKSYVPTVTVDGTQIFTNSGNSMTHYAHTRWVVEAWIGGDPALTPEVNTEYLIKTKLVPNYWKKNPSASVLNGLYQTYAPVQSGAMPNGDWTANMGDTGFQQQIGLIPNWDALYVTSGADSRAYASVIANAKALNSYPIIWCGSVDDLPCRPTEYPTWSVEGEGQGGATSYSAGSLTWDIAHHGSGGYLAYLITGDYFHLETMQHQAAMGYLMNGYGHGSGTSRLMTGQTRATAWVQRSIGQLVGIAPLDTVTTEYQTLLASNATHWKDEVQQAGMNLIGYIYSYELEGGGYGTGIASPWQQHFWVQTYGMLCDLEPFASMTTWNIVRDFLYKSAVGILGPNGTDYYCFTKASTYTVKISDSNDGDPTTWYDSWGVVYEETNGAPNNNCQNTLEGTSGGDPANAEEGYWGNLLPAIAYAVDHEASGAAAAWGRLTGATNWSTVENAGFDDIPAWGIIPRT